MENEGNIYRVFIISISITVALFLVGIFLGVAYMNRNLFYEQTLIQARAHFESIVITRKWNAMYGGVYVEKKEGVVSNPYLRDPEFEAADGKIFTMRNPAFMTREISELASQEGLLEFHMTSLKPLNPVNSPDEFEQEGLKRFEYGDKEYFKESQRDGKDVFRYIAPLYVEEPCLACHASQGYKLGDVRGGISITLDIDDLKNRVRVSTITILALGLVFLLLMLVIIYYFTMKLINKLSDARRVIEEMAITDDLTGLFNRRNIMERFTEEFQRAKRANEDLGCIMIDIDHFKKVNDTYGHQTGDRVLHGAAELISASIRVYDVIGRYGGEEFLVLLPNTDFQESRALAERIRLAIKERLIVKADSGEDVTITISLGVTNILPADKLLDEILRRADMALYNSKTAGRDRTMSA